MGEGRRDKRFVQVIFGFHNMRHHRDTVVNNHGQKACLRNLRKSPTIYIKVLVADRTFNTQEVAVFVGKKTKPMGARATSDLKVLMGYATRWHPC